jgi:hypothetical protein
MNLTEIVVVIGGLVVLIGFVVLMYRKSKAPEIGFEDQESALGTALEEFLKNEEAVEKAATSLAEGDAIQEDPFYGRRAAYYSVRLGGERRATVEGRAHGEVYNLRLDNGALVRRHRENFRLVALAS